VVSENVNNFDEIKCLEDGDIKHKDEYHRVFNLWRDYDYLTTLLAMVGLVLCVASNETNYFTHWKTVDPEKYSDAMDDPRHAKSISIMIRVISIATTVLAVYCLIQRHYYKNLW